MNVRLTSNLGVSRASWALVALFALGCLSVLGYSWATRAGDPAVGDPLEASKRDVGARGETADAPARSPSAAPAAESVDVADDRPARGPSAADVAQWSADTSSDDPEKRAKAITSLAKAPKAEALPVLRRVLNHGEPLFDRPLAIRSLRDLAIAQGDEDGSIQDALRYATYHEADPDLIRGAEAALDAIAPN
jgi:hypothetical protein